MDFLKKLFSSEGKEKDPICGMTVNTQNAQYKSIYQGKTYYFCSEHCKNNSMQIQVSTLDDS